jgi:hypothetical protein
MSRIESMTTQHVSNYLQRVPGLSEQYSLWMMTHGRAAFEAGITTTAYTKALLGKQDYCWTGSVRNWIWERPVEVTLEDGRTITRKWRLYASSKGLTLEVEDGGRPWGDTMYDAAPKVWAQFLAYWNQKVSEIKAA